MNPSVLYSNAVISGRQNKLLNTDRIKRMINAATEAEVVNILLECGYDEDIIMDSHGRGGMIVKKETIRTAETFIALCPDENLLKCALSRYDYRNARAVYKSKFADINLYEAVYPFGTLDRQKLKDAILHKRYGELPRPMAKALTVLDAKQGALLPKDIDTELEKARYAEIADSIEKIKESAIKEYFKTEIDLKNIKAFARIRLYKPDEDPDVFIEGGYLKKTILEPIRGAAFEEIKASFIGTKYTDLASKLCEALAENDLTPFENYANLYLIRISYTGKDDVFGLNLFFNWFILKLEELKVVRLMFTAKKFNFSRHRLREILKESYGEFW